MEALNQHPSFTVTYGFDPEALAIACRDNLRQHITIQHQMERLRDKLISHKQIVSESNQPPVEKEQMLAEINQSLTELDQMLAQKKADVEYLQIETSAAERRANLKFISAELKVKIQNKLIKGKTLEQIADELEEEVEDIRALYNELLSSANGN